jgi:hypothetical protein
VVLARLAEQRRAQRPLDGRTVTTEFYDSYGGGTLGYSIVAGAALDWGTGGRLVTTPARTTG